MEDGIIPVKLIDFEVNGKIYKLLDSQLEDFPLRDAYLSVLWRNFKTGQMNVEVNKTGAVIVKARDSNGHNFKNFPLIAKVYANPQISLFELLEVDSFLKLVEKVKSRYPIVQKKLRENSTMPQYDNLSVEHYYSIKEHQTYSWLERSNYEKLREEFKFYGIDELPSLNPGSGCESLNPAELLERFEEEFFYEMSGMQVDMKNYHGMFYANTTLQEPKETQMCRQFLYNIKGMNGVISGSLVLKSILQEPWNSSDIDVYVTEENLHNFICKNAYSLKRFSVNMKLIRDNASSYLADHMMSSSTTIITTELKEIQRKLGAGTLSYMGNLFIDMKNSSGENIEEAILIKVREELMIDIVELFNGENGKMLSKRESVCAYDELNGVSYVIRFTFLNRKVDLVVCKCHVPFVISNFDFAFNKVYYDGYSVNCLDWEAVSTKVCVNDYCSVGPGGQNDIERYVYNISRIKKYFKRGFLVLL